MRQHGTRLAATRGFDGWGTALPRLIDLRRHDAESRQDLLDALYASPPAMPARYFYDELGSALFTAITHLPEYYPARLEREILARHAHTIADLLPRKATLIDLGAGNGSKAQRLLKALRPARYLAVDIAGEDTQRALQAIEADYPETEISVLACDFASGIAWPRSLYRERPVFFFPGSSIGNFSAQQARSFLHRLCQLCRASDDGGGRLLLGVDLIKERRLMLAAYDDALGVTAAFNRNLLRHLNYVIGADFDVDRFHHHVQFNDAASCIEMWLVPDADQQVRWQQGGRVFHAGEGMLTECSHKYSVEGVRRLLASAGFDVQHEWLDDSAGYLVCDARSR